MDFFKLLYDIVYDRHEFDFKLVIAESNQAIWLVTIRYVVIVPVHFSKRVVAFEELGKAIVIQIGLQIFWYPNDR
jgi:hypothetical protein